MSLKDEIDKLISAERALLEQRDTKEKEFDELQKTRFLPLRAVLEQMIESIDPAYLRTTLTDYKATIEVGKHWDNEFEVNIEWQIEPMATACLEGEGEGAMFMAQPGFSVREVEMFHFPEFRQFTEEHTFETEGEVAQHILKKIVEKIAHYQHLKASTDKRNSADTAS